MAWAVLSEEWLPSTVQGQAVRGFLGRPPSLFPGTALAMSWEQRENRLIQEPTGTRHEAGVLFKELDGTGGDILARDACIHALPLENIHVWHSTLTIAENSKTRCEGRDPGTVARLVDDIVLKLIGTMILAFATDALEVAWGSRVSS